MNQNLLLRELNPRYDLSRHDFDDVSWFGASIREPSLLAVNLTKSVVRGGAPGALIGTAIGGLCGLLAGEDIKRATAIGTFSGGILGAGIDLTQYAARYVYRLLKKSYQINRG